jgi:hypothetical protein
MNDRELLELAAKATGDSVVWGGTWNVGGELIDCTDIPYLGSGQPDENDVYWNPLEDDGDALRLAVKLNIQIDSDSFNNDVVVLFTHQPLASDLEMLKEPHNDDPYAATRRAIVRAAAEIGRNMK